MKVLKSTAEVSLIHRIVYYSFAVLSLFVFMFLSLQSKAQAPVITVQPVTQTVCPGAGNPVTFSVTATGSALTYQWKKNTAIITGATASSYTISSVATGDAAAYNVVVTNPSGSKTSTIAYLNTFIVTQPTPATQTIATGNSVTFSVAAANNTGFQWLFNGTNIPGSTSTNITVPVTTSAGGNYSVRVINSAGSGCATITSNAATLVAAITLYSKSTGNLNDVNTWGVATNGTGSKPVNFTRAEHVFKVVNQTAPTTGGNLTIAGTLDVGNAIITVTDNTTLAAGRIFRSLVFGALSTTGTCTVAVSGISDLYFSVSNYTLKNLVVGNAASVTLRTPLDITSGTAPGKVTVQAGSIFNTSDYLTLKSDADGTASIGASGGDIIGNVTIERYIPARRAWRLMTSPISATDAPTINTAWQESAANSTDDPTPGYGTHITGGTEENGFDISPTNSPSLKYYDAGSWKGLANTNATAVTQYPGYLFFVRGNRSYDILSTTNTNTPSITTLRATGSLVMHTQTSPVASSGFTLLANTYASPVSFASSFSNSSSIINRLRVWDPTLAGTAGTGAFVTLDWNGSRYVSVPPSSMTETLQAGQAFFVEGDGSGTGSFVMSEADKVDATSTLPFDRIAGTSENIAAPSVRDIQLGISLRVINTDATTGTVDGVLAYFNNKYSNTITNKDAIKVKNFNENLSIDRTPDTLSIERIQVPFVNDTLRLLLTGTKTASYQLKFLPIFFAKAKLVPVLFDAYLNSYTTLSTTDSSLYPFTVSSSVAASKMPDRFKVIFTVAFKAVNKAIVAVNQTAINSDIAKARLSVFPNPVTGRNVNLQINDEAEGKYNLKIYSSTSSVVYAGVLNKAAGSTSKTIQLPASIAKGSYTLSVQKGTSPGYSINFIVQ